MSTVAVIWFHLAAQAPAENLPFVKDLATYGPYGFLVICMGVIKHLWSELKSERADRFADLNKHNTEKQALIDKHDTEKQALNDKVLNVSRETTTAVLQNTEVQRQLLAAMHGQED